MAFGSPAKLTQSAGTRDDPADFRMDNQPIQQPEKLVIVQQAFRLFWNPWSSMKILGKQLYSIGAWRQGRINRAFSLVVFVAGFLGLRPRLV